MAKDVVVANASRELRDALRQVASLTRDLKSAKKTVLELQRRFLEEDPAQIPLA